MANRTSALFCRTKKVEVNQFPVSKQNYKNFSLWACIGLLCKECLNNKVSLEWKTRIRFDCFPLKKVARTPSLPLLGVALYSGLHAMAPITCSLCFLKFEIWKHKVNYHVLSNFCHVLLEHNMRLQCLIVVSWIQSTLALRTPCYQGYWLLHTKFRSLTEETGNDSCYYRLSLYRH